MFDFKEGSIIICNDLLKEEILRSYASLKKLSDLTFYNLKSFKENFYFSFKQECYYKTMEVFNCSYANSKIILPFIYYVNEDNYQFDQKTSLLYELKEALIKDDLLIFNPLFKHFLKRKKVYVFDNGLDKFSKKMFKEVEAFSEVEFFKQEPKYLLKEVRHFTKAEVEVDYLFESIRKLLDSGVNINKIFIINNSSYYNHLLKRYGYLYQIGVSAYDDVSLIAHPLAKKFLGLLKSDLSLEEIVLALKVSKSEEVLFKLITLINKFNMVPNDLRYEVFKEELSMINYEKPIYTDVVKVLKSERVFNKDEYVFVLDFTNGKYPKLYKDDSYLGDKYQNDFLIDSTTEKNKLALNEAINSLSSIPNLSLSYSDVTTEGMVPSSLISLLNLKEIEPKVLNNYSKKIGLLDLGLKLDKYLNFNEEAFDLRDLVKTFPDYYLSYDNRFNGVSKDLVKEKLKGEIRSSYTSISDFFGCKFAYFLKHVLKLNKDTNPDKRELGTAFHAILAEYGKPSFDLEKLKEEALESFSDFKQRFYFLKLWDDFLLVIEFLDNMKDYTMLTSELHEQEINLDYSNDFYKINFKGILDKVIFKQIDGVDYCAIIDYKTGTTQKPTIDNFDIGLNLQLPIYALLLYKSGLFKNPDLLGIFLQFLFTPLYKTDINNLKPMEEIKKDKLKLQGYHTNDLSKLPILDQNYAKSSMIRSLSLTKDGKFNRFAKLLSSDDINRMVLMVENLIKEAFIEIIDGDFKINPKVIDNSNVSCKFCLFKDHCFKQKRDEEVKENHPYEVIFGGEE